MNSGDEPSMHLVHAKFSYQTRITSSKARERKLPGEFLLSDGIFSDNLEHIARIKQDIPKNKEMATSLFFFESNGYYSPFI
jgi:hypothetical protein